jgi:hypothetical protein
MSQTTITHYRTNTSTPRPAFESIVESLAIGMLRWSERRAEASAAALWIDRGCAAERFTSASQRALDSGWRPRFY